MKRDLKPSGVASSPYYSRVERLVRYWKSGVFYEILCEQDRPDVAEKRRQWRAAQAQIDPAKVVFIDETWAKTNMTRRYGRSLLTTRLIEKVPCGRWQTTTFLGALRAEGFVAPLTVEGPINGAAVPGLGRAASGTRLEARRHRDHG